MKQGLKEAIWGAQNLRSEPVVPWIPTMNESFLYLLPEAVVILHVTHVNTFVTTIVSSNSSKLKWNGKTRMNDSNQLISDKKRNTYLS